MNFFPEDTGGHPRSSGVTLSTGSRGVKFVRKNYSSYILPYKIHNRII